MIKDPSGIILIIIGILFLIKPVVIKFIQLQNMFLGSQANISAMTIWYYRICGLAAIIIGCLFFFAQK